MKETYEPLELEVIQLDDADVITTSNNTPEIPSNWNNNG